MVEDVGGLAGWVLSVIEALGYGGIALLVALETFVPPIPSEVVLPASGFLVSRGALTFTGVLAAATLGSLAGSLALYEMGRRLGPARVERWVARRGRWVGLDPEDLDRAQAWFARHGHWAVLGGRLVPALRSLVSLPAGLARMPVGRFLLLTGLGSLAWNALLLAAGWRLGESWSAIGPYYEKAEWTVWGLVAAWVAWRVVRRRRRHSGSSRRARAEGEARAPRAEGREGDGRGQGGRS